MTDEKIQEKATEWIRSQGWNEENLPNDEYCQMCDAFLAGAKENGVIWHDLRRNPNDLQKSNGTRNKKVFKKLNKLKPLSENDQTLYFVKAISGRITLATAAEILRDMACGCFFTEFALVEDVLKLYSSTNYLDALSLDGDGQCYLKNILEIFLRELNNLENQTKENLAPECFVAQKILNQINNMAYYLCAEAYNKIPQDKKGKK